ncbi:MAG: signal recognition particle receptor subunit alpha, partial [Clostridia bacterium]|nr:signal recognition particle receptor subunit alpha [Clostridia bacterium]
MFESLSEKLSKAFKFFRNKGKLTEADVKAGMREIKLALLEADVNFKVVRDFVKMVSERAVGAEVLESLVPAQQVVKIVNEEMIRLMGETQAKLTIAPKPPTVVMMVGLQGAGKTSDHKIIWKNTAKQDDFLESMADACRSVVDYMGAEN